MKFVYFVVFLGFLVLNSAVFVSSQEEDDENYLDAEGTTEAPTANSTEPHIETTAYIPSTLGTTIQDTTISTESPTANSTEPPIETTAYIPITSDPGIASDSSTITSSTINDSTTTESPQTTTCKPIYIYRRKFDFGSFVGGIILTCGLLGIGYGIWRYNEIRRIKQHTYY